MCLDAVRGTYRSVCIQLESSRARVERRDLGDVIVFSFALLLLELERDAANGTTLDALHKVGGETGDLVPETFRGDNGLQYGRIGVRSTVEKQGYGH